MSGSSTPTRRAWSTFESDSSMNQSMSSLNQTNTMPATPVQTNKQSATVAWSPRSTNNPSNRWSQPATAEKTTVQSMNIDKSINQPMNQPMNQSVNQINNQPINQSNNMMVMSPATSMPQPTSTNQLINQPMNLSANQSTSQMVKPFSDYQTFAFDQTQLDDINQSTSQVNNQSVSQPKILPYSNTLKHRTKITHQSSSESNIQSPRYFTVDQSIINQCTNLFTTHQSIKHYIWVRNHLLSQSIEKSIKIISPMVMAVLVIVQLFGGWKHSWWKSFLIVQLIAGAGCIALITRFKSNSQVNKQSSNQLTYQSVNQPSSQSSAQAKPTVAAQDAIKQSTIYRSINQLILRSPIKVSIKHISLLALYTLIMFVTSMLLCWLLVPNWSLYQSTTHPINQSKYAFVSFAFAVYLTVCYHRMHRDQIDWSVQDQSVSLPSTKPNKPLANQSLIKLATQSFGMSVFSALPISAALYALYSIVHIVNQLVRPSMNQTFYESTPLMEWLQCARVLFVLAFIDQTINGLVDWSMTRPVENVKYRALLIHSFFDHPVEETIDQSTNQSIKQSNDYWYQLAWNQLLLIARSSIDQLRFYEPINQWIGSASSDAITQSVNQTIIPGSDPKSLHFIFVAGLNQIQSANAWLINQSIGQSGKQMPNFEVLKWIIEVLCSITIQSIEQSKAQLTRNYVPGLIVQLIDLTSSIQQARDRAQAQSADQSVNQLTTSELTALMIHVEDQLVRLVECPTIREELFQAPDVPARTRQRFLSLKR